MGPLNTPTVSSLQARLRPFLRGGRSLWLLGLLLSALVALLASTLGRSVVEQLEERTTDAVWRLSAEHASERRLVVVDIDERSLREVGPWPWSREVQARLMERLGQAGVRQQVWDVVFAGEGLSAGGDRRAASPNQVLAQTIAHQRPTLAQIFSDVRPRSPDGSEAPVPQPLREGRLAGALAWPSCPEPFPSASGHLANHPALLGTASAHSAQHAHSVGHITPVLAADGVLRHQAAVICQGGKAYPSLALAALDRAAGNGGWSLRRGTWLESPWVLTHANGALPAVPLGPQGEIRIGWRQHPDNYIALSAADVLAGRVPGGLLEGAWVLVGGTAFGLNDRVATPFAANSPGMIAHAQLLTNLLDGRTPHTPKSAALWQGLALLGGLLMLAGLLRGRLHPGSAGPYADQAHARHNSRHLVWLPLAALLWVPLLLVLHALLLVTLGWVVGWVVPAVSVAAAGLGMGAVAHARSRMDRERLYAHLASYLPAPVAAVLAGQGPSGSIQASQRHVSVMFADIRNFSAYCEARPPQEAAAVLHEFFTAAHRIVESHGGVVEGLQGDSVVATWNADSSGAEGRGAAHASAALQAARQLIAAMDDILPNPCPAGLEPLALGVGLETGPAMTGSIGPSTRRTHTVMGRTVTIASRLVGMTSELAHPLLVGEGMAAQLGGELGGQRLQSMGTFILEGLRVPHHVYAWPLRPAQAGASSAQPGPSVSAPPFAMPAPEDTPAARNSGPGASPLH